MEKGKPKKDLVYKWKCEDCWKSFKYKKYFVEHMRVHTGEKPYTCNRCGKKFSHKNSFMRHTWRMVCPQVELQKDQDDKFVCGECGELFNHRWDWLRHGLLHTGKNPYKCTICHKNFSYSSDLQQHIEDKVCIKEYSKKDLSYMYKCEECGKSYKYEQILVEHRRLHTMEKPYSCDRCGKKFSHKDSHWNHMRHMLCSQVKVQKDQDDKFMCSECGELFDHRWDWLRHGLLHTGKNTYKCTNCHKNFSYSADLQQHIEDKVCIKEYSKMHLCDMWKCEECGKAFKVKEHIVVHRRFHTGQKPGTCVWCSKKLPPMSSHCCHKKYKLGIKQKLLVLEDRVEVQRDDLANSEYKNHPKTAEEHYQKADNIQSTLVLNPKFSQYPSFHKQTAQHGPSQDQSYSYVPSSEYSEGDSNSNINIEQEQGKSSFLEQDSTQLDFHILLDTLNQLTEQTHSPLKQQATHSDTLLNLKIEQSSIPLIQPTVQHASPIRQQTVLNSSQDQSSSGYLEGNSNSKCQQEQIDSSFVLQSNLLTFYSEWSDIF